ncbi:MAG: hypothetical protein M3434_06715 [Gemmatimonadota bacterium]|nr:hypothetical protein [Gemmatimonadota bacterium]
MRFRFTLWLLPGLFMLFPPQLNAQLRPLDPLNWWVMQPGKSVSAELGAEFLQGQRASLAGVEGELLELGKFRLVWQTGRVSLEAAGTLRRVFQDQSVFADPVEGTRASDGSRRIDSGDYRVATTVRLTPERPDLMAALRFGARLPTTDNRVGLERDQTDFFALVAGRIARGGASLAAETGVGIFGSSVQKGFEQSDVLLYALTAQYETPWLAPSVVLVGQADGLRGWTIRGNEDLRELRFGVRTTGRYWIRASLIRGLTDFSPRTGLAISAGLLR